MQADKSKGHFLLLTVAISVCMVFGVLLISTDTERFQNARGIKRRLAFWGVTDEQTAQLHQNENIAWVGWLHYKCVYRC